MLSQCLPPSFSSIRLTIREQMRFEDFQDGHHGGILNIGTERFWQFWISMSLRYLPSSFCSIQLTGLGVCGEISLSFGGHLGYWNETILAVLNLYVSLMPPTKFQLKLTYRSGGDVVSTFSGWPPWRPSWISQRNDYNKSKFLCRPNASHHAWAHST